MKGGAGRSVAHAKADDRAARRRAGAPPATDPDARLLRRCALGMLAAGAARFQIWSTATARRPPLRGRCDARAGRRPRLGAGHTAQVESAPALAAEPRRITRPQWRQPLLRSHQATALHHQPLPQTRLRLLQPSPPHLHPFHDETECTGLRLRPTGTKHRCSHQYTDGNPTWTQPIQRIEQRDRRLSSVLPCCRPSE